MTSTLRVVHLFAGAGGLSVGIDRAAHRLGYTPGDDFELHAVNHWEPAIQTHERNFPWADAYHAKIQALHPPDVVDPGTVDLLAAGPECTEFTTANGGQPVNEQKRATAWEFLEWVEKLRPDHLLVENVPQFRNWGPVDDDGTRSRDGTIFQQWVDVLGAFGYSVIQEAKDGPHGVVLNAADYGDPTCRRRLFILASRDSRPTAPTPTHAENPAPDSDRTPWRPAREILDLADVGGSIWTRDLDRPRVSPPAQTTMARIAEGVRRHCDPWLQPLADVLEKVDPDTLRALRDHRVVPLRDAPLVADAVDEPFLVACPATDTTALTAPYLLRQQSGGVPAAVDEPLPTVAASAAVALATPSTRQLVQPRNGPQRGRHSNPLYPVDERPFHVVTAQNTDGHLVTPEPAYLCPGFFERPQQRPRTRSLDRPLMTVPARRSPAGLATPFLVDYHGQSDVAPIDRPLGAVERRDRFALCVPDAWPWGLDVHYRMLTPTEVKHAQGFPRDYELAGDTKTVLRRQIGNAVPCNLSTALVHHLLTDDTPSLATYGGGLTPAPDAAVPDYSEVVADD